MSNRVFNKVTKQNCPAIKSEVMEALKVLEANGLIAKAPKNITYDPVDNFVEMKIKFLVKDAETGETADLDRIQFDRHCFKHGLSPDDFGTTFILDGVTHIITGCSNRKQRAGIFTTDSYGKKWKVPHSVIVKGR